ncbi:protein phosphatase 1 regulatory subunit 3G [Poecilia formosa]|nr:PREDICTED: protein phosphatase 1 regulatory subunit 3G [Poecilia formosa]
MIRSAPPCGPNRAGQQNGLRDEEEDEEDEEGDLEDEVDASHLEKFMRDRRRARSLPTYPAALLDGGRKRVKFADSMGLSLARIKHFSAQEDPQIPPKVLSRYQSFPPQQQDPRAGPDLPRLLACFPEPRDAERRVRELRVCLERLAVTRFELRGQVRVLRGCAVREVGVRLTYNDWLSYVDAQAVPVTVPEQPGSESVRFGFTVFIPPFMDPGTAVHFAVFLRSDEGEFWDNNQGQNYSLRHRNQNQPGRPDPEPAGEASPSL